MSNDAYVKQLEAYIEKLEAELALAKEQAEKTIQMPKEFINVSYGDKKYKIKNPRYNKNEQ